MANPDQRGTRRKVFSIGAAFFDATGLTANRTITIPDSDVTLGSGGGGGVTDHGALTGLADDDHPQYHNNARGDARYSQLGHGHAIADSTGLQTALDGKQPLATVLTNTTAAFTTAQETKLAGIATAATANATDAALRDRATHTGTQAISTVTSLQAELDTIDGAITALATGKADTVHTHTASQVTDFSTAADARIAAASVNALADVTITAPSDGQVLKYSGGVWVNDTDATGGGGGGLTQPQVSAIASLRI